MAANTPPTGSAANPSDRDPWPCKRTTEHQPHWHRVSRNGYEGTVWCPGAPAVSAANPHGSCLACGHDLPWVAWHVDAEGEPTIGLCATCKAGADAAKVQSEKAQVQGKGLAAARGCE